MPVVTLPDGSQREYPAAVSVAEVAASIGAGLAKAALAGRVNDRVVDTSYLINEDAALAIITDKDPEGLEVIRHSTAHLLAQAVKRLYPTAQVTIGPVIEQGFYYDFAFGRSFTPEDLIEIEAEMTRIVAENYPVSREELSRDEAIAFFRNLGEEYKAKIIEDIPANETLSLYRQGEFVDLCRGPHVPHTGRLKAFKLTKVAGAYWRGDSKNEMLQRIYGTAWPDKKALDAYLERIAEAEKRDHRLLAKRLDLYHIQPEAPGEIFWHPKGWRLVNVLREYLRNVQQDAGYEEINTPLLVDEVLWQQSGHKAKFGNEMFSVSSENHTYLIKPMSCPCHIQIFKDQLRSYRDLPIRYAEFGHCHRSEPSGTLHGLMRVRGFVQDDGHIFCTEEQIQEEVLGFIDQLHRVYRDLGFTHLNYKLSTRPENRVGSEEVWDKAEQALAAALDARGLNWQLQPGEGAFYGPKIEFSMPDCLGREWQCGTIQVDFSMPERLGAYYISEQGDKKPPVMLHRAILGTFERFLGILIEQHAGKFPLWLAPTQVAVMTIASRHDEYAHNLTKSMKNKGLRVNLDLRNEKIGFKIREHTLQYVPYLVVIGDKELEQGTVSVRTLAGKELGSLPLDQLIEQLVAEVNRKGHDLED
jgi:threonyl-tRNA synthetase